MSLTKSSLNWASLIIWSPWVKPPYHNVRELPEVHWHPEPDLPVVTRNEFLDGRENISDESFDDSLAQCAQVRQADQLRLKVVAVQQVEIHTVARLFVPYTSD